MRREVQHEVLRRLRVVNEQPPAPGPIEHIDARRYTDGAWLDGEREVLFRRRPVIVAHGAFNAIMVITLYAALAAGVELP